MAPKQARQFVFMQAPVENVTQRDRELQIPAVRAHSAKLSHTRRQLKKNNSYRPRESDENGVLPARRKPQAYYPIALGEGRIDPFDSLSSRKIPQLLQEALDHGKSERLAYYSGKADHITSSSTL